MSEEEIKDRWGDYEERDIRRRWIDNHFNNQLYEVGLK